MGNEIRFFIKVKLGTNWGELFEIISLIKKEQPNAKIDVEVAI